MDPLTSTAIGEFVDELELVDHHAHGCHRTDGSEERFQNALNESCTAPLAVPATAYDSQVGFAVRRWCAPVLDLEPHAPAREYWSRRARLGEREVTLRMLRSAGVGDWLIDTGFAADALLGVADMAGAARARAHEVVRIEAVAEALIADLADPADYPDAFRAELGRRCLDAVATKSVMAYRIGFEHDLARPPEGAVVAAARRWRDALGENAIRLVEPILLRFGLHTAIDLGLPVQLHVGFGDRDLDLRACNPLHLLDFLRTHERTGVPVMLLHCYPFEREAGYLAQAFETVHVDVGLAVNFVGARSESLIARSFELAPFGKVLYSSDGIGPAELHYLGARLWRTGTARVLDRWVREGHWSDADARRVAAMVGRDNARRVYRL